MRRYTLLAALALAGCTVGPNYKQPSIAELPVPPAYTQPSVAGTVPAKWWKQFADPELDRLIALTLSGNFDLTAAAARIEQARAQVAVARSSLFPTLDGTAGINRIDFSKNAGLSSIASAFGGAGGGSGSGGSSNNGIALPGSGITTFSLGVDASWEVDLFGSVRRQVEGARARADSATWNQRDLQVSLAAEVASDYLQLRSLQNQIEISRTELERQQATLRLVTARRQSGLIAELPERQQSLQLSNVSAQLPTLQAQANAQVHALGVLAGQAPDTLAVELDMPRPLTKSLQSVPPQVPTGLPSELLRRRPDVRAAERQLAAATADIGVAVADLYPKFNLMGVGELLSTSLATLFERNSIQTTIDAAVSVPILDFGARRATVRNAKAARDEAYANYQKAVLGAVRDVDDALVAYTAEQRRNAELRRGVETAGITVRLARAQFDAGLVDFTDVLNAQGALLSNRNSLAQSDATLLTDLSRLYKALGGGWETVAAES